MAFDTDDLNPVRQRQKAEEAKRAQQKRLDEVEALATLIENADEKDLSESDKAVARIQLSILRSAVGKGDLRLSQQALDKLSKTVQTLRPPTLK